MESLGFSAGAWWNWASASSWQITVLVALVAIVAVAGRRLPARFRYVLWSLILVKALMPPTLGWQLGVGTWGVQPVAERVSQWLPPAQGEAGAPMRESAAAVPAPAAPRAVAASPSRTGTVEGSVPQSPPSPAGSPATLEATRAAGQLADSPALRESSASPALTALPASRAGSPRIHWTGLLLAGWLVGGALFIAVVGFRYVRLLGAVRRARVVDEGPLRVRLEQLALCHDSDSSPDLLLSHEVSSPFLMGLLRPRIVLPADLPDALTPAEMDSVLLHELVHWKRRDVPVGWLQVLVQALFWFHPFVWFANSRLRHERESACDAAVLSVGECSARGYGEALLKVLLAARGRSSAVPGFLGIFERDTRLQHRLEAIMNPETRRRAMGVPGWLFLAAFAAIFLPMASAVGDNNTSETAKAKLGQFSIESGEVFSDYDASGTLKSVRAEKGVVLKHDGVTLTGDSLTLDPSTGKVVATGSTVTLELAEQQAKAPSDDDYLAKLTQDQRLYVEWTDRQFRKFLDNRTFPDLSPEERDELATKLIDTLKGPQGGDYYLAINTLGALRNPKAVAPLLGIAADRREKDNRDRWMAIRALGMIGDKSVVPELIHLVYAPNQNTRFWAQISLVRLTGENFGTDWEAWGRWWTEQNGAPPFKPEKVAWTRNSEWMDPAKQSEVDREFIAKLKGGDNSQERPPERQAASGPDKAGLREAMAKIKRLKNESGALAQLVKDRKPAEAAEAAKKLRSEAAAFAELTRESEVGGQIREALAELDKLQQALEGEKLEAAKEIIDALDKLGPAIEVKLKQEQARLEAKIPSAPDTESVAKTMTMVPVLKLQFGALVEMVHDGKLPEALEAVKKIRSEAVPFLESTFETEVGRQIRLAIAELDKLQNALEQGNADAAKKVINTLDKMGPSIEAKLQRAQRADANSAAPEAVRTPLPHAVARASGPAFRTKGPDWCAKQATGEPDTANAADLPSAWASLTPDGAEEWLEVDYDPPLVATMVRIHETFNPGAVTQVILKDAKGAEFMKIPVTDSIKTAPAFLEVPVPSLANPVPVKTVRIVLDSPSVPGWNEIDAVQLVGPDSRAWAVDARASSSFADRGAPRRVMRNVTQTQSGFALDSPIPVFLEWGTPENPGMLKTTAIEFKVMERQASSAVLRGLTGELTVWYTSWPKAEWEFTVELLDADGKVLDHATTNLANAGIIHGVAIAGTKTLTLNFRSAPEDLARNARQFRISVAGAITAEAPAEAAAPPPQEPLPPGTTRLTHVGDKEQGKRSIGAGGHAVAFKRSGGASWIEGIDIFASRYGTAQPPPDDFHLTILNADKQVLADIKYPYALIERGDMKWYSLRTPSIEVPEDFTVALAFNPHQTKGIYLGFDKSQAESHSMTGLPDSGYEPMKDGEEWMVRVHLTEQPSGAKGTMRLADWKPPVKEEPFKDCIEAKHDNGRSDNMQSYGSRGPAIQFKPSEFLPKETIEKYSSGGDSYELKGVRVYGSRYGSGYDPEQAMIHVTILDSANKVLGTADVPYSKFSYKEKWVDLPFAQPVAITNPDEVLTIALNPEAHQTKGIYFHYNKDPQPSHSSAGTVQSGFAPVADREWMIRAFFAPASAGTAAAAGDAKSDAGVPRIVSTVPAVGETDVDPAIKAIKVTFDRDMGYGFSWTGGGPEYPPVPAGAKAEWKDNRTCVLPVRLEAAHFYRVGINSTDFQHFRSTEGVPALPSAIYFTTRGASDEQKARLIPPTLVSIEPSNGAVDVSPSLTEIRATFSTPMAGGYSWVGGGMDYPEKPDGTTAYWTEDKKTCVLPVSLKPNWVYHIGLNSPSFTNFMSEAGVPLEPVKYKFMTGAASPSDPGSFVYDPTNGALSADGRVKQ